MAFDNFFSTLTTSAADTDYTGIFGTTAQTVSLSANLNSLSAEGSEIVKWVRYRLGEPKLPVELDNNQIFAAFEEANIEFGAQINKSQASNWLSSFYGLNRDFSTENLTNKLPHHTLDFLIRMANPYASEAGLGGIQNQRKAYCSINTTDTDYSILNDFTDASTETTLSAYVTTIGVGTVQIKNVLHQEPSTLYRFYDPYSSANLLSQEFKYESFNNESVFYMQPIFADILRGSMLETNDRVRRSNHSYHIAGDRIRFLPKPSQSLKVWIEYTTAMDPTDPDFAVANGDPSVTGINSIHNIPFTDIRYDDVNASGKAWIRQYTLAISMEILGRIRRKFSSIPIPNGEITLDGDALVGEAIEKQQALKEEIKEELEKLSNPELLNREADMAEAIQRQLQLIPAHSPLMLLG
tara:strand:+ start:936 stop:2165 length:1230 start_codon:yes stop_codon:yes gene_type:complete